MEPVSHSFSGNKATTSQIQVQYSEQEIIKKENVKLEGRRKCNAHKQCIVNSNKKEQKRPRVTFNPDQLSELEREYAINPYLTRTRRIGISNRVGLDERAVKVWFQNRRVKSKRNASTDLSILRPDSMPNSIDSRESETSSVPPVPDEIDLTVDADIKKEAPPQSVLYIEEIIKTESNEERPALPQQVNVANMVQPYQMYQTQHTPQYLDFNQQSYFPYQLNYQSYPYGLRSHYSAMYDMNDANRYMGYTPANLDFRYQQYQHQPANNFVGETVQSTDWRPPVSHSEDYYQKTFWDNLINSVDL